MATRVDFHLKDGTVDRRDSTLLRGQHLHENDSEYCISEKTLLGEEIKTCHAKDVVDHVVVYRCKPCEELNPTQRSDIKIPGEK